MVNYVCGEISSTGIYAGYGTICSESKRYKNKESRRKHVLNTMRVHYDMKLDKSPLPFLLVEETRFWVASSFLCIASAYLAKGYKMC